MERWVVLVQVFCVVWEGFGTVLKTHSKRWEIWGFKKHRETNIYCNWDNWCIRTQIKLVMFSMPFIYIHSTQFKTSNTNVCFSITWKRKNVQKYLLICLPLPFHDLVVFIWGWKLWFIMFWYINKCVCCCCCCLLPRSVLLALSAFSSPHYLGELDRSAPAHPRFSQASAATRFLVVVAHQFLNLQTNLF